MVFPQYISRYSVVAVIFCAVPRTCTIGANRSGNEALTVVYGGGFIRCFTREFHAADEKVCSFIPKCVKTYLIRTRRGHVSAYREEVFMCFPDLGWLFFQDGRRPQAARNIVATISQSRP